MGYISRKYRRLTSTKNGQATLADAQAIDNKAFNKGSSTDTLVSGGTLVSESTVTPEKGQIMDSEMPDAHSIGIASSVDLPAYEDTIATSKSALDNVIKEVMVFKEPEDLLVHLLSTKVSLHDKLDMLDKAPPSLWTRPMERFGKMKSQMQALRRSLCVYTALLSILILPKSTSYQVRWRN